MCARALEIYRFYRSHVPIWAVSSTAGLARLSRAYSAGKVLVDLIIWDALWQDFLDFIGVLRDFTRLLELRVLYRLIGALFT